MRRILLCVLVASALAACLDGAARPEPATTTTSPPPPTTSTTAIALDPADPALHRRLGIPSLEEVDWRRTIEGQLVVGMDTRPVPEELVMIGAALREVPEALASEVTPRAIVRIPELEEGGEHEGAAAFARGPDVYLLDRTFAISPGGSTRLDLARAYLHELGHVAQFLRLEPGYVEAVLEGRLERIDPASGSLLVREFAAATGWEDRSSDPLRSDWRLPEAIEASTPYGRTGPDEDMAEALALVALGRAEWIPEDRSAWVEAWLGADADELARGKPWAPAGSTEVLSEDPIYEEDRVAELTEEFDHAEPLYFALPNGPEESEELAETVAGRLADRGLEGSLERVDDPRLPRFSGLFRRPDGSAFWVELWDFRGQTGFSSSPDHPVLSYVALW